MSYPVSVVAPLMMSLPLSHDLSCCVVLYLAFPPAGEPKGRQPARDGALDALEKWIGASLDPLFRHMNTLGDKVCPNLVL